MSGAGLEADVEGVGPTVVLKQMYYRHRLDLSCAPDLGPPVFPPFYHFIILASFFSSCFPKNKGHFHCSAAPRLSARCSFQMWLSLTLFFSHPLFHFPQCCFCFFLAVHTNICFVRVTSHIPNHRESRSQRQQTGADPEIQPRLARIECG